MKNKKQMRENWQLGFLGFLCFQGLSSLVAHDWLGAIWIVWFVWFIYFIPLKNN